VPARIITTASGAHQGARVPFDDIIAERSFRSFGRYGETKLANILFTAELARRLQGTGITANCYHPGLVATGFNRGNGLLNDIGMTALTRISHPTFGIGRVESAKVVVRTNTSADQRGPADGNRV
jgi:NAD(P)-dependent dehydrogenase (short-subunit alcohol dehydrogenase family)